MLVLAYFIDLTGVGRWTLLCIVAYTVTAEGGLVSGEQRFLRDCERVGTADDSGRCTRVFCPVLCP